MVNNKLRGVNNLLQQYKKPLKADKLMAHNIYRGLTSGLVLNESDRRHLLGALSYDDILAILAM